MNPMSECGNTAAIREALEEFVNHASCLYHCDIHRLYPETTSCDGVLAEGGECPMKPECDAVFKGRAALAKPPRNCDVFESEADRQAAFIAYYNEERSLKGTFYEISTSDLKHDTDSILIDYVEWLFKPAKPETKGETNGSK